MNRSFIIAPIEEKLLMVIKWFDFQRIMPLQRRGQNGDAEAIR